MNGKLWTKEEDQILRNLATTTKYKDIGAQIGRSKSAVCARAMYLGVTAGRPKGPARWSETELMNLHSLVGAMEYKEIAEILDRPLTQVRGMAWRLGLQGLPKNHWRGENHWAWRGGNSHNYGWKWVTVVRPQVLERDGYLCQEPTCKVDGSELDVHHIVPRRFTHDDTLSNLVSLCRSHHSQQPAHWWIDFDHGLLHLLPGYQRNILRMD